MGAGTRHGYPVQPRSGTCGVVEQVMLDSGFTVRTVELSGSGWNLEAALTRSLVP